MTETTLETKEVRIHDAHKTDQILDAEVQKLQNLALARGNVGILVTRHAPGRFTLELCHDVPFGYTHEKG